MPIFQFDSAYCERVMTNDSILLQQKFDGSSEYLDSFFVQFEIACQINIWLEIHKTHWLVKCLEGPALSYVTGILQYLPTEGYDILKQALYEKYDLPQTSYKVAFKNRTLREVEDIIEYGWDLKYLAVKAYCGFGNFRVTFISRFFHFRIIREFLNSRASIRVVGHFRGLKIGALCISCER